MQQDERNLRIVMLDKRRQATQCPIHGTVCKRQNAAAAKLLQLCPILSDPIDGSSPGPTVPGVLQARTLEWVNTKKKKYNVIDSCKACGSKFYFSVLG